MAMDKDGGLGGTADPRGASLGIWAIVRLLWLCRDMILFVARHLYATNSMFLGVRPGMWRWTLGVAAIRAGGAGNLHSMSPLKGNWATNFLCIGTWILLRYN